MKFLENWALLNGLYKHFNSNSDLDLSINNEDSKDSRSMQSGFPFASKPPKRSYESAFGRENSHQKAIKEISR